MLRIMVPRSCLAIGLVSPESSCLNPSLMSGGRIFSARMYNSLAASSICFRSTFMSVLHAPFADGTVFQCAEDQVLDHQADQNDREQAGEHVGDLQLVLVLVDVPAQSAGAGAHAEHQLGGDQRAPGERPADLQAGEYAGAGRRNEDLGNV